jgi:hypothetical protein
VQDERVDVAGIEEYEVMERQPHRSDAGGADQAVLAEVVDETVGARLITIRAADTGGHRSSANILVHRMYATRGYATTAFGDAEVANVITLIAVDRHETIGTISLGSDSPDGLLADDLFLQEIDELRARGRRVGEFTKLAVSHVVQSKRVLASLFHTAYIWAHRLMGFDDIVIEVNPRHVRYYQRALGFTVMGPERLNRRVDAPAVLLRLDLAHARRQIDRYGGRPELGAGLHSLYPNFFSAKEEAGIVGRLPRAQALEPA